MNVSRFASGEPVNPTPKSPVKFIIILVVILGIAYAAYQFMGNGGPGGQPQMGGAPVNVALVESKTLTVWQEFSGRLEAVENVQIKPRVTGTIDQIHFKDGDMVTVGQKLFTLDQKPFLAELRRAEAALNSANNDARVAKIDLQRAQNLIKDKFITKRELDARSATASTTAAQAKSAESALEIAKLNFGYTEILAPVSGRISRAEITVGNLVDSQMNTPVLATIVSQDPIYAGFEMDEQSYLHLVARGQGNTIGMPVKVSLANDTAGEFDGMIQSVDNALNTQTGTIRMRAVLPNKEGKLVPGLFARVKVGSPQPETVLLISDRAIGTDQNKKFVMVVDKDNKAEYREIKLGAPADNLRIVESGLKEGDKVIVNGLQRVRPGSPVMPTTVPMDPNAAQPVLPTGAAPAGDKPAEAPAAEKAPEAAPAPAADPAATPAAPADAKPAEPAAAPAEAAPATPEKPAEAK